jgi:glutamate-ammonia-ligase adenylyltransferase
LASTHLKNLRPLLHAEKEYEQKLIILRNYKKDQFKRIEAGFPKNPTRLQEVMEDLAHLADALLIASYELAQEELRPQFGFPCFIDSDGNFSQSELAIIGMGKLGGNELHLNSDLDLIFVYSRNGDTNGKRKITNKEYFAKLCQRMINILTLPTPWGYLYKVDTELRPSGRQGTLVTPIDAWLSYYHEHAESWEQQALLKARLIYASGEFSREFTGLFRRLIFLKSFKENLHEEIDHYRQRIEKELAKETEQKWNYKKGMGGLLDIEFLVQYLQLKLGKVFEQLITPNTLEAIDRLSKRKILSAEMANTLQAGYQFYRTMEFFLESKFDLKEGFLNLEQPCIPELANEMGFKGKKDFLEAFGDYRNEIRGIYLNTLKINS